MKKIDLINIRRAHKKSSTFSFVILCFSIIVLLGSCGTSRKASGTGKAQFFDNAAKSLLDAPELKSAHVGISVYDPSEKQYLYNHDADKYFIPASNTKLITCYAAMKYLGDSLAGIEYQQDGDTIFIVPTGDPTLLHPDFSSQPVVDFLRNIDHKSIVINTGNFNEKPWGVGWSWDDYMDDYMPERSALPVYGNLVTVSGNRNKWGFSPALKGKITDTHADDTTVNYVHRDIGANNFIVSFNGTVIQQKMVPFFTDSSKTNIELLQQQVNTQLLWRNDAVEAKETRNYTTIHSQPTDSLLTPMMHRSDNFFAEQSLLMVSNTLLGTMNDEKIIDTLLKTDYKRMPQQPQWVDGSGLSRFNLFTPQDFVFVLDKMRNEFDWKRITTILPTGGTGTLAGLYEKYKGRIYAKTGTLGNNVALSGYIITASNKTLIFSVLVGNHTCPARVARKYMEQFLSAVMDKY